MKAFKDVLAPFQSRTGIHVHLTTNRDSTNQIANGIAAGTDLPDIAPAPTDTQMVKAWVSKGAIKAIETALGDQFQAYVSNTYPALTTPPSGHTDDPNIGVIGGKHYELMVTTQVKGLFWYNKRVFTGTAPTTFDQLLAINPSRYGADKLFCAGFEAGASSGFSAADQFDNILIRQVSAQMYSDWVNGRVAYTDPKIKLAYQTFLKEVDPTHVYGSADSVLTTNFAKAGDPLFTSPAGCLFYEQGPSIVNFFTQDFPSLKGGTNFDFFLHPTVDPQYLANINGSHEQFALYNDTPAARKLLMQYMATPAAQQIWANDGVSVAAIRNIRYNDPILAREASIAADARSLLPDAYAIQPVEMQHAFWTSFLKVTKEPASLDQELSFLDQVRQSSYP